MDDYKLPSFVHGNYKYILQLTKKLDTKSHQIYRVVGYLNII